MVALGASGLIAAVPLILTQPISQAVRSGESVLLSVSSDDGGASFQWRRHGFDMAGATSSSLTLAETKISQVGFYDVVVTNGDGASVSQRARVSVYPAADPGLLELDPTWTVKTERAGGNFDAVAPLANGGFVVTGNFLSINGHATRSVVKVLADGSVDTSFSCGIGFDGDLHEVFELADGRLLIAGAFNAKTPAGLRSGAIRLMVDGAFDPSFEIDSTAEVSIQRAGLDETGRLYGAGVWLKQGESQPRYLFRIGATGGLDESYAGSALVTGFAPTMEVNGSGQVSVLWTDGATRRLYQIDAAGELVRELSIVGFGGIADLALGSDDSLYVYGFLSSPFGGGVRKFLADGSQDTNYDGTGLPLFATEAKVLSDGSLAAVATTAVVRLDASGQRVGNGLHQGFLTVGRMAVDSAGRALLIGSDWTRDEPTLFVKRFNADYSVDSAVGLSVRQTGQITRVAEQADGKLVVAGEFDRVSGEAESNLTRLNADGSIDASFTDYTFDGGVRHLERMGDGRWLIAGAFANIGSHPRNGFAFLSSEGEIDHSFVPPGSWQRLNDFDAINAVQPLAGGAFLFQSYVVIPGVSPSRERVFRFRASGVDDDGFGDNFKAWAGTLVVESILELRDGSFALAGYEGSNAEGDVAWIQPDGQVRGGFPAREVAEGPVVGAAVQADEKIWYFGTTGFGRTNAIGGVDATLNARAERKSRARTLAIDPDFFPQADGSLITLSSMSFSSVAAGGVQRDFAVRLRANGSVDPAFAVGGLWRGIDAATQRDDGQFYLASDGELRRTIDLRKPMVAVPTGPSLIEEGERLTLTAEVDGLVENLQWLRDGLPIAGATSPVYFVDQVSDDAAGDYSVVASNSLGLSRGPGLRVGVLGMNSGATGFHQLGSITGDPAAVTLYSIAGRIDFTGQPDEVEWAVVLPSGWTVVNASGVGATSKPVDGVGSLAEWRWESPTTSPLELSYDLVPSSEARGRFALAALLEVTNGGAVGMSVVKPDPLYVRRISATARSSDLDGDFRIGLSELLRVIELYNTRIGTVRSGGYRERLQSVDGFETDPFEPAIGSVVLSRHHTADTDQDGRVSLSELLGVIEVYNARNGTVRTGEYAPLGSP